MPHGLPDIPGRVKQIGCQYDIKRPQSNPLLVKWLFHVDVRHLQVRVRCPEGLASSPQEDIRDVGEQILLNTAGIRLQSGQHQRGQPACPRSKLEEPDVAGSA